MDRYIGSLNEAAVNTYASLAKDIGLTPTQSALSWCNHCEHVASTIIGATTMSQLHEDFQAYAIRLDDATLSRIGHIYKQYTEPRKSLRGEGYGWSRYGPLLGVDAIKELLDEIQFCRTFLVIVYQACKTLVHATCLT
jgi:Aldo/keto reductase family